MPYSKSITSAKPLRAALEFRTRLRGAGGRFLLDAFAPHILRDIELQIHPLLAGEGAGIANSHRSGQLDLKKTAGRIE